MKGLPDICLRGHAWALRLYPPGYRAEFGEEQELVFRRTLEDALQQGSLAALSLVLFEMIRLPGVILRQHRRERRKRMENEGQNKPKWGWQVSWGEVLLAMLFFVLPMLNFLSNDSFTTLPILRGILVVASALGFLAALVYALVKRAPRWSLPFIGLLLSIPALVGMLAVSPLLALLAKAASFLENGTQRLIGGFLNSGATWLFLFLLAALLIFLLSRRMTGNTLYERVRGDWTQMSFLLYGGALFVLFFSFDEYQYQSPYQAVSLFFLALGALGYLAATHPWQRLLSLLAGLTLGMGIAAVGKYMIVPLQDWGIWFTWNPPETERWFEMWGVVIDWGWLALILLAPALWRRRGGVSGSGSVGVTE